MNFGPFIWTALSWSSRDLVQSIQNKEMKLIVSLQTQERWCRNSWTHDELWSIYSNSFVLVRQRFGAVRQKIRRWNWSSCYRHNKIEILDANNGTVYDKLHLIVDYNLCFIKKELNPTLDTLTVIINSCAETSLDCWLSLLQKWVSKRW